MATTQSKFSERDLIIKGMYDPLWWMQQCGWSPWEKQIEICKALISHDRVAVPAAFGVGKTYIAGRIALWWLNTHVPSIVVTTAPTGRQVRDLLWAEIRDGFHGSRMPLGGEVLTTDIRMDPKFPKWFATGFATNEEHMDKFTGYHSPNMLLIFDQGCGIHKQIWTAGEGLLTSENCKWLVLSNTTDEKSEFANLCMPGRKSDYGNTCEDPECKGCAKWKVIKIRAYDSPNVKAGKNVVPGVITHDYIEKKKEVWRPGDPLWEIYIEANFVESGAMTVLHPTMVREILETNKVEPDFSNINIGVDVGDEGSDPTIGVCALGKRLGFIERILGNNPMQVVQFVIRLWEKTVRLTGQTPQTIYIDKIGVGSGVCARLVELGYPVTGVNVGMKAINDTEFLNRRIEMAWQIREMAEAKAISWKPFFSTEDVLLELLREDMGVRYQPLPSQKIKLEDKRQFRQRLRRSSDIWDAMTLAFADSSFAPGISAIEGAYGSPLPPMPFAEQMNNAISPTEAAAQLEIYRKLFSTGYVEESDFTEETVLW